jgi:hypothetical protein
VMEEPPTTNGDGSRLKGGFKFVYTLNLSIGKSYYQGIPNDFCQIVN